MSEKALELARRIIGAVNFQDDLLMPDARKLAQALIEAAKDTERLDWLEKNPESGEPQIIYHPPSGDITWKVADSEEFEDLRKAIDAAIGKEKA